MDYNNLIKTLINGEKEATSSEKAKKRYLNTHNYRFDFTLDLVSNLVSDKEARVLDVGRSFFFIYVSELLSKCNHHWIFIETR